MTSYDPAGNCQLNTSPAHLRENMNDTVKHYMLSGNTVYCNYCPGYCCYRLQGSTLFIDAIDINRIARHFNITDGEVRKNYIVEKNTFRTRPDGSCTFLTNGKMCGRCSIHEARPRQCREFPYSDPCPYLEREDLLATIQPRVEESLKGIAEI